MFFAAVAFACGILCGTYLWRPPLWWLVGAIIFLLAAIVFASRNAAAGMLLALAAFLCAGALQFQLAAAAVETLPDISAFTSGEEVSITAHVVRSGLLRESSQGFRDERGKPEFRQVLDVESEQINGQAVQAGIRLSLHSKPGEEFSVNTSDDDSPDLSPPPPFPYGTHIQVSGKLREPRNYGNPGAMDYVGYLRGNGIIALASARADRVQILPGFSGTRAGGFRSRLRQSLLSHMLGLASSPQKHGMLALTREDAGLLAAMIIGEQSLLDREMKADFQRTGTFHVLVVSGMNVAILAFVIFWLCKRLRAGEITATLVTIISSLAYAYVTDLGTPILRAAIMLSLYLAARLLYRDRYSLNSVGTAALIVLLAAPPTLYEPSFQLTFLSVVALSSILQPLLERTSQPYAKSLSGLDFTGIDVTLLPKLAQFRIELRMLRGRLARLVPAPPSWQLRIAHAVLIWPLRMVFAAFALFAVAAVMQLALALPMSLYFHRIAIWGVPSNMAVVPLTEVLMPAGIAATLLSYVSMKLAIFPVEVSAACLHAITWVVSHWGGSRFAEIRIASPVFTVAVLSAVCFALAMLLMRRRRFAIPLATGTLFLGAIAVSLPSLPQLRPAVAEITLIDVGQGDSVLVVSPDGHTLLVDGGGPTGGARAESFDVGEDVVSPYLWSRGITHLDAVALTHAHSDHLSGLHAVINNFKPGELWVGANPESASYRKLLTEAQAQHTEIQRHSAGEDFGFGGMDVRVLAPTAEWQPLLKARNDDSLVLDLKFGSTTALLTGDVEKRQEAFIAQYARHADLLKVAHHGSATSTTPELLEAVEPKYAAISVGAHSIFGHPKPAVLSRLAAAHVRTFRTDTLGVLTFYLDGKNVLPPVQQR